MTEQRAEVSSHIIGGRVTVGQRFGHRLQADSLEFRRDVPNNLSWRLRLVFPNLTQKFNHIPGMKWSVSRQHPIHDDAERVDIRFARRCGCPGHQRLVRGTCSREFRKRLQAPFRPARWLSLSDRPKSTMTGIPSVLTDNVGRLQVSMDRPVCMRMSQRVRNFWQSVRPPCPNLRPGA